ncbi:hypothetical protein MMC13_006862 [Lambiella insularis]|nr:hypothetical protein [Lambiella insularis]
MPLLHRSKKDREPPLNLRGDLPPSPPSSFNSGGANSSVQGGSGNNQTVTTTTTTTTTTTAGGTYTQSEPRSNVSNIGSTDSGYQGSYSSSYAAEEPRNGGYDAPNVPRRSEMREHQQNNAAGFGPSSPNYSRPMGTTESLKAAAHGIHGAGEVLRGTFNSAIDRGLNQPSDVVDYNRNVALNGRQEINSQPGHRMGHHIRRRSGSANPLPAVDERTQII